ncbi:helicase associated domain-containing protein [Streptomyces sp. NPDC001796]|uniref:helicase associated domain-containing protein n=1 Tax=Streptomyces sp. NPDC001796 TaxID=3364609 RepID=UPI00369B066D
MSWGWPPEAAWEENLAAARAYFARTGTLAAPVTATALDKPVGQWLANCRKNGGLTQRRAEQLAAIDPDWRPEWPVDWQRNYAGVARLVALDAEPADIVPGVTSFGADVGRWLQRQRQHVVWEGLAPGQRKRLTDLTITPLLPEQKTPAKGSRGALDAFERGCAALAQYRQRTGTVGPVSRSHVETVTIDGEEHPVKLGVFLSNTKTRRAGLSTTQLSDPVPGSLSPFAHGAPDCALRSQAGARHLRRWDALRRSVEVHDRWRADHGRCLVGALDKFHRQRQMVQRGATP